MRLRWALLLLLMAGAARGTELMLPEFERVELENGAVLLEAETIEAVRRLVNEQMAYYNRRRRHSALDYQRPEEVLLSLLIGGDITGSS